jgi:hypothetical protein
MSRQYYGIEDLALTAGQRGELVAALKQLGDNQSERPCFRNHIRVRPDNRAVIFEGSFNDSDWTAAGLAERLANLFGVSPAVISSDTQQSEYGPVVTFSAGGTDRLRMIAFGGLLASWQVSHELVKDFLANNLAEWEAES